MSVDWKLMREKMSCKNRYLVTLSSSTNSTQYNFQTITTNLIYSYFKPKPWHLFIHFNAAVWIKCIVTSFQTNFPEYKQLIWTQAARIISQVGSLLRAALSLFIIEYHNNFVLCSFTIPFLFYYEGLHSGWNGKFMPSLSCSQGT